MRTISRLQHLLWLIPGCCNLMPSAHPTGTLEQNTSFMYDVWITSPLMVITCKSKISSSSMVIWSQSTVVRKSIETFHVHQCNNPTGWYVSWLGCDKADNWLFCGTGWDVTHNLHLWCLKSISSCCEWFVSCLIRILVRTTTLLYRQAEVHPAARKA